MKKMVLLALAAAALATPALAADLKAITKAPKAPDPGPWDVAFGAAFMSDYNFRGVTAVEPQAVGLGVLRAALQRHEGPAASTSARAAPASRSRTGQRPKSTSTAACGRPSASSLSISASGTIGYPGGQCFNNLAIASPECWEQGPLPVNGNVIKSNLSFYEFYAKGVVTVNEQFSFGAAAFYSPSVLNSGAKGTFVTGNVKYTAPSAMMAPGWGAYVSAEVGHWFLGTSDAFYCTQTGRARCSASSGACILPYPNGIPYKSYTTWNVGFGITKSVFTLDFRYYDTDLNQGDCNAFTSDHTARFNGSFTAINPGGFGSNWCSQGVHRVGQVRPDRARQPQVS